jgi:hypothetical protein
MTASDDCGACERFAVTARDVGWWLAELVRLCAAAAVERSKKTARVRAGRLRRTDGRR